MISTKRLVLRRARPEDLLPLHAILSDPAAMRYWATPEHTTLQQTRDWLDSMMGADPARSDEFILEHRGQIIGKAGAWKLPDIAYILHQDFWRQGLMTEAMAALLPYLFRQHDLPRLTAEADPRNSATIALLKRLGFAETHRAERTLKWKDEWCDSIYFALPRPAPRRRVIRALKFAPALFLPRRP